MFRLQARIFKESRILNDFIVEDASVDTRTHKINRALDEACRRFDLGHPVWLTKNVNDFKKHSSCRFAQDNFIEEIPFDCLEIKVIEEDGV